jgi:sialic acid synthase SpsE
MGRTHIIAEMAWGHDGSPDNALNILRQAKKAGADSISVHITHMPDYMVPHYMGGKGKVSAGRESLNIYNYLEQINLQKEDWLRIRKEAARLSIGFCVMPNDLASLEFAETGLDPDYYVLSPASFVEDNLLYRMADTGKDTIFRIGGATLGEIERALGIFRNHGSRVILLHGFQNYPTRIEETNLALLSTLKDLFGLEVGLADHIDGGDPLARIVPLMSLAYGATFIEKHLTLDRNQKSEDFESALDPEGFTEFVGYVREVEKAIGFRSFESLSPATVNYRSISRKRVVAIRDIGKGEALTETNIGLKRSDSGESAEIFTQLLGRKARVDISRNEGIHIKQLI